MIFFVFFCPLVIVIFTNLSSTHFAVHAINSERTEACTDSEGKWPKPSQAIQDLYPKGKTIEELYTGGYTPRPSSIPSEDQLAEIAEELASFGLTESSLYKTVSADISLPAEVPPPPPASPVILEMFQAREIESPLVSSYDFGTLADPEKRFILKNVAITEADRYVEIFQRSLSQSESGEWHLQRGSRISASQAKKIHTAQKSSTCLEYFKNSSQLPCRIR